MDRRMIGIVVATVGSSAWGFMGLFTRQLGDCGLSVYDISLCRSSVTALFLGLALFFLERDSLKVGKRGLLILVFLGLSKLISDACLFTAQSTIPLALAGILQLTYPYFVLVFAFVAFGEKLTRRKIAAAILGVTGCALVADLGTGGEVKMVGIALGIISSVVTALNIIGNKRCMNLKITPAATIFYMFLFSALFTAPFSDIPKIVNVACTDLHSVFLVLGIGILLTLIPHVMVNWSMSRTQASIIAIIGIMEAIVAAIVGVVFFDEVPTPLSDVGIVLAVIALVLVSIETKKNTDTA